MQLHKKKKKNSSHNEYPISSRSRRWWWFLRCSIFIIPSYIILMVIVLLLAYNSVVGIFFYNNIHHHHHDVFGSSSEVASSVLIFEEENERSTTSSATASKISSKIPPGTNESTTTPIKIKPRIVIIQHSPPTPTLKKSRRPNKKPVSKLYSSYAGTTRNSKKCFSERVTSFFSSCSNGTRFFMTWISSSLSSFGSREKFTIETLFRSHSSACVLIVSASMDSPAGLNLLAPFHARNLSISAISPNYLFLFRGTPAAAWFNRLTRGKLRPGEVSIGQNLSNLLRLALLYRYGGIYIDTDFIVLRSLSGLRNTIGAQNAAHSKSDNKWSRLNNAVMVFDEGHPLLRKFIDEFAFTFNGNKWGYNGPYLVSRVVKRVVGNKLGKIVVQAAGSGFDITVLPPAAFYPVDWRKIGRLFRRRRLGEEEMWRWLEAKEKEIRTDSYGVHLWNRQSKRLRIEEGSVIGNLMLHSCLFCNHTMTRVLAIL